MAMRRFDFDVLIDGKIVFSSNDVCNALAFYDSTNEKFKSRGIKKKVVVFFKGKKLNDNQIRNTSWC